MRRFWLGAVLFQMLVGFWPASGVGLVVADRWMPPPAPPSPPHWPPPWHPWRPRPEPYVFAPLEVASIHVRATIQDQLAVTTIEQEFYNPNAARVEGTFVCPLPKGAQVNKFTMEIDGKPCEAELLPADKARKIFEDIVRTMKDPALLEYAGRDLFKVRIFPFEPKSKRRITLKYTELLKNDSGMIGYVLPLSVEKFSARPVSNVVVEVELESARPLKSIYSPSHQIEVKRSGSKRARAVLECSEKVAPADFALYFSAESDEIGMNLLTFREPGEDGFFLFMASPGVDVPEREIVAKDIVFVLDTSGSMAGKKLEQAKKALEFCIENLNDKDRFEIVRFATEVEPLFDKLVPATDDNRKKALGFTDELKPMGGTAIDDALQRALSMKKQSAASDDRPTMLIFLTDGRPTIGETGEDKIVKNVARQNPDKDRIFCFGIGTDVNTHLLDKVTEQTRAFSQYVLPEEDLELKVSSFFSKIKEPVLANPTLKVSGDPRLTKMYPSDLPDLFKGEQMVVAGRYSGGGDAAFTLAGKVNGVERTFIYEGRFPQSASRHDFLPRLWATRRVGYLLEEIRLHGEDQELKDEVTRLAKQFGIVTPYTSYLIVEDEDRRRVPHQARLMPQLSTDVAARKQGEQVWGSYTRERGGAGGTWAARENNVYKYANSAGAAAYDATTESMRALGMPYGPSASATPLPEPDQGKLRLAQYSQQAHFVAGKTFFQNNTQWTDSAIQQQTNAPVVSVKFGSDEYFELGRNHPEALPWLALGRNVQFALGNRIYQVQE